METEEFKRLMNFIELKGGGLKETFWFQIEQTRIHSIIGQEKGRLFPKLDRWLFDDGFWSATSEKTISKLSTEFIHVGNAIQLSEDEFSSRCNLTANELKKVKKQINSMGLDFESHFDEWVDYRARNVKAGFRLLPMEQLCSPWHDLVRASNGRSVSQHLSYS